MKKIINVLLVSAAALLAQAAFAISNSGLTLEFTAGPSTTAVIQQWTVQDQASLVLYPDGQNYGSQCTQSSFCIPVTLNQPIKMTIPAFTAPVFVLLGGNGEGQVGDTTKTCQAQLKKLSHGTHVVQLKAESTYFPRLYNMNCMVDA
jgi:hypothetical protein